MSFSQKTRFQKSLLGLNIISLLFRKNKRSQKTYWFLSGLPFVGVLTLQSPALLCIESSLPGPSACEKPTPHNRQENVDGSVFTFLHFLQDKACVCLCKILTHR